MPVISKQIADLLASIEAEAMTPRDLLIEECRDYIHLSRAHMCKEEAEILSLAGQLLDDADWAAIAGLRPSRTIRYLAGSSWKTMRAV